MERARQKKLHSIRIIITNILMGVSVFAIVSILILLAMGFTLTKDGGLERSGLLQVRSRPSGATVQINGQAQFSRTEMSKMLSEGNHDIVVTKTGYSTWTSSINIEAGLLTRIDWVRLFPLQRTVEDVHEYKSLKLVSTSLDKHYLALLPENSTTLQLINISSDDIKYSNIDLMSFLLTNGPFIETTADWSPSGLKITQWSENHSKFLLKWNYSQDATHWYLVDVAKPENSINLTAKFAANFTDLQIADPAATKIWVTDSKNLRMIHTDTLTISGILLNNVEKFSSHANTIGFIGANSKGGRIVGIYQEDAKGSTTIHEIPDKISAAHIALSANWLDNWVAYTLDNRLFVRAGNYPVYGSNVRLTTIAENDLDFTPVRLSASPTGRFAVASSEDQLTIIDAELKNRADFAFPGPKLNWLDSHILWTDQDDQLTIVDFNGENRRNLTAIASGFDLALTTNNRWLYFLVPQPNEKPGFILQRERL